MTDGATRRARRVALAGALGLWLLNLAYLALVGWMPGMWDYHFSMGELAFSRLDQIGNLDRAEAEYRLALDYAQLVVPCDGRLARTYYDLGLVQWTHQQYPRAKKSLARAEALFSRYDGPGSLFVGVTKAREGEMALRANEMAVAEARLAEAEALVERNLGPQEPLVLRCQGDRALVLTYTGRRREALQILTALLPKIDACPEMEPAFRAQLRQAQQACRIAP